MAERPSQRLRADVGDPVPQAQTAADVVAPPPPPIAVAAEADVTYPQLVQAGPPQDPVPEFFAPDLVPAVYQPTHVQVADPLGKIVDTSEPRAPPPIGLVAAGDHPTHAFAFLPHMQAIDLRHHGAGWGEVRFAVVYHHHPGDAPHVFRATDPDTGEPSYVAIKILNKAVVQKQLNQGGRENPYKEICRYQELGDNVHVIRCEALEDDERLFIVTPKGVSLVDRIFGRTNPMPAPEVRAVVLQLLRILVYLMEHNIHQRDFSPDNLFFLPSGQLVLADMAMSLRIPRTADNAHRTLMRDQGTFGTPAWTAPEILHRFPFDGVATDLWSVMLIAYNCLTGQVLYRRASPTDWSYQFFVLAGGLTADALNEQAMEVLEDMGDNADAVTIRRVQEQAMAHMAFGQRVRDLLSNVLSNAPHERWTLGQVLRCAYIVQGPD